MRINQSQSKRKRLWRVQALRHDGLTFKEIGRQMDDCQPGGISDSAAWLMNFYAQETNKQYFAALLEVAESFANGIRL